MNRRLFFSVVAVLSSICTFGQMTNLTVGNSSRSMYVYAPSGIEANKPLVISLHGMNQDINYQKNQAKWELVADTARFVVVYPAGINGGWDINGNTDTDFISAIIDNMYSKYKIDKKRVYLSGFSMGGMMTYHAMNVIADKIAAFAPVSGYPVAGAKFTSSRPIPIIHTNGDADDVVHYEPWSGTFNGMHQDQVGAEYMCQHWADANGCTSTPEISMVNNCVTRRLWKNGECGVEVCLNKIPGKGHWHSNDETCYHTTREIWKFIRRYTLDCGSSNTMDIVVSNSQQFIAPANIDFAVIANVENATITKLEMFNGTEKIGDATTSAPYGFIWTDVKEGKYSVTAVATLSNGEKVTSSAFDFVVNVPQGPKDGIAHDIPGIIQAEDYDLGGQGSAYQDSDEGNSGNLYREDNVDITESKTIDGYQIGWTIQGEWLEYTVSVKQAGSYTWTAQVAAQDENDGFRLSMDGQDITDQIIVPSTGDWDTYKTISGKTSELTAGEHVLRLAVDGNYFNIDWIKFEGETTSVTEINNSKNINYTLFNLMGVAVKNIEVAEGQNIPGLLRQMGLPEGVYILKSQEDSSSILLNVK
jgi:poly(3-hydroxybutyrate) depolymerase